MLDFAPSIGIMDRAKIIGNIVLFVELDFMKTMTRNRYFFDLSGLTLLVCAAALLCISCGGGGSSSSNSSAPPAPAVVPLTASDVTTVVQNAVMAVDAPMAVSYTHLDVYKRQV